MHDTWYIGFRIRVVTRSARKGCFKGAVGDFPNANLPARCGLAQNRGRLPQCRG